MHELSIVEALIDQVSRELEHAGRKGRVLRLELRIGRLSGVNPESIRFAIELVGPGTPIENAEVVIREPKALCNCHTCRARVEIDDLVVQCPRCAGRDITIEGGKDLILQTIEVEDLSP